MPKFNWIVSTLLVSATIVSGVQTQSMQKAVAQTNPFQFKEAIFANLFNQKKDNEPTARPSTVAAGRLWEGIFGDFFNKPNDNNPTAGKPGPATGRGGVCVLTPRTIGTNTEVWSDRPLFVWQTGLMPIQKIEVRLPGSQQALWSKEVPAGTRSLMYGTQKPLQPGQTYNWVAMDAVNKKHSFTFKVMDAQKRDRITAELKKLEEELKAKGATPEEIALQRAEYFADQQLWSDVLQEIYSVKNPSPVMNTRVKAVTGEICNNLLIQNFVQSP
ncbi:MAG TPA: hypothetical protein V6C91_09560 [Coleofasciculaceae cyanobacterium]